MRAARHMPCELCRHPSAVRPARAVPMLHAEDTAQPRLAGVPTCPAECALYLHCAWRSAAIWIC